MIVTNWFGVFGPAHLPRELLTKLYRSIVDIMHSADGQAKFTALSLDIAATTPQESEGHLKPSWKNGARLCKRLELDRSDYGQSVLTGFPP
jgi:tripartite-type tricarboxylate transporter receptor subunit TctC